MRLKNMINKKKVGLISGASGFIGKYLSQRLLLEGWEVHAIVRPETDINHFMKFSGDRVFCHCFDGTNDKIATIIRDVQPTVVFHLASLFLSSHEFEDITPLISSNIIFSTQLVEAMTQNGIFNLVNTGTSWQHYQNEKYNPVNLYAATKQAFIDILKYYQETTQLKSITLKLFDTYGPHDTRHKLIYLLNKIARTNEVLKMSPGEQLIDLVYIDDVVDAFFLAANYLMNSTESIFAEYAVTSSKPIRLRELVAIYENVLDKKLNIEWGERPYRQREVMETWNNGNALPGWSPQIGLEMGIEKIQRSEALDFNFNK